ncbi:GatB/YqeY domain-containing protein [Auricularia subglabra TFB-10046 SS5]|nr:GatB/YqeY domain-containing protein [Auricularia subglabra TFB-10046 SS5]
MHSQRRFAQACLRSAARLNSTVSQSIDIRVRLQKELLQARKARDAFKTAVLRSASAEIDSADKKSQTTPTEDSAIALLRKLIALRRDAERQYTAGGRADLAENELKEADFLATFLPLQKSEAEIDSLLRQIIAEQPDALPAEPTKAQLGRLTGTVIKAFKSTVDLTTVDMEVVAKRLQTILAEQTTTPA